MESPGPDVVEVNVFGPGFGECVLVHLGSGNWMIVDSCEGEDHEPAALKYLTSIGVDPATAVKLIVITHWHDDHVRGIGKVVRACTSSQVCFSAALGKEQFVEAMYVRDTNGPGRLSSGVREIRAVLECVAGRKGSVIYSMANTIVLQMPAAALAHGENCEVRTLTPSGKQFELAMEAIAGLMPTLGQTRSRATAQSPNHLSVVTWVCVGEVAVLLGADLEERSDPATGWSAVAALPPFPAERAQVFKIPHHGSATGHSDRIWNERVADAPIAVVTPWSRSSGLPSLDDVKRITSLTPNAFATSKGLRGQRSKRLPAVERQLREMGVKISSALPKMGHVQLRRKASAWVVSLSDGACLLQELL